MKRAACNVCGDEKLASALSRSGGTCMSCRVDAGAAVDATTRYEDDPIARRFVVLHPFGATLDEVGAMFGVTRERIRQIEERALQRIAARLREVA